MYVKLSKSFPKWLHHFVWPQTCVRGPAALRPHRFLVLPCFLFLFFKFQVILGGGGIIMTLIYIFLTTNNIECLRTHLLPSVFRKLSLNEDYVTPLFKLNSDLWQNSAYFLKLAFSSETSSSSPVTASRSAIRSPREAKRHKDGDASLLRPSCPSFC